MCSARWTVQAVALILASAVYASPLYSQSPRFLSLETKLLGASRLTSSGKPCHKSSSPSWGAQPGETRGILNAAPPCEIPVANVVEPLEPCASSSSITRGCASSYDFVRDDLNTMGKQGHSILRARDRVLEILQAGNACTDWYETKDADPAATFRTLTFALDRNEDVYVQRVPEPGGLELVRSPYIARVLQGEGARSTVTINVDGAFFLPMANVMQARPEGGTPHFQGTQRLQVGSYSGGTLRAQILTLLHEFGHVINLLPPDRDDEAKSPQNTAEVLRHCRAEVEAKEGPRTILASR